MLVKKVMDIMDIDMTVVVEFVIVVMSIAAVGGVNRCSASKSGCIC